MKFTFSAFLLFGFAPVLSAAIIGTNISALPLTRERIARLPKDEQKNWKKYLDRSEQKKRTDQQSLFHEMRERSLHNSLPAPKGRKESNLSLRQNADWYGTPEALHIADVVISFQTPSGGWAKGVNMIGTARKPGGQFYGDDSILHLDKNTDEEKILDWNFVGTFDNNATSTQMRYLAKVISAVGKKRDEPYRAAFMQGLDFIFASQYPNGGWPQVWPLQGGYNDAITFNDDAMLNTMQLLNDIANGNNDFTFLSSTIRDIAKESVQLGLGCILKTQIMVNGHHTVWCQQHDALTLQPTAARNYEMPSQCDSESARLVLFLMRWPRPDAKTISAVQDAAAWFEKVKLRDVAVARDEEKGKQLLASPGAPALWARYYQIGTDRPIFGDRDKTIHDDMNEISKERRNGYGWFNTTPQDVLDEYANWAKVHPK